MRFLSSKKTTISKLYINKQRRTVATSKKPLTIIIKRSTLDVAVVLDPPLISIWKEKN